MNNLPPPLVIPPSPKGALRIADYDRKLDNQQESKSPLGDLGVDLAGGFRGGFTGRFSVSYKEGK